MFIDLLSESCEEGEEFLYWVTKMSQYFEDKFFQIILNVWLSFTSYFSYNKLLGLGMPLFTGHIWEVYARKLIVIIIKHHTTHTVHSG